MQNERAQSTVTVNGEQAKQELNLLESKAIRLREALIQAGKAAPSPEAERAYSRLKKELAATDKEIRQLTKSNWDIKKVLDNLSGASMRDLIKAQKELTNSMNKSSIDRSSEAWKQHANQLKAVKTEIALVNAETKVGQSGFMKFAEWTNQTWQLFAVAGMAITGVITVLKKYMDMKNELEDTTANLKALTGLEDKDVNKLRKWAEQMASNPLEGTGIRIRSSVNEIMNAYKLVGSAKPELLAFPEQLNEVTKNAMIMSEAAAMPLADAVMGLTTSLNQYGAAADKSSQFINVLGAGAKFGAKEIPYIGEALTKFGALAKDANVPLEESVAIIETLGAKGHQADVVGTGMKQMFVKMMAGAKETNPAIVGMDVALDNLNKKFSGPGGFNKMIDMFGEREVVIARSLIANREEFKNLTKQVTGTQTAIEQAGIASNTTNAKIAQATNQLGILAMQLFANVSPAFLKVANLTNVFLKVIIQLPAWLKENAGLLWTLTGVMISYTIAVNAFTIAEKAKNVQRAIGTALEKANMIAQLAGCAIQQLFAGNLRTSQLAMKALNEEMKLNPYIAVGIIIAAVTIGIYKLATGLSTAEKAWRDYKINSEIETSSANQLFEALKKASEGTELRAKYIKEINSKYGEYLQNQLTEKSNLNDINEAQMAVNSSLREKIAIETRDAANAETLKNAIKNQVEYLDGIKSIIKKKVGENSADILVEEVKKIITENQNDLPKANKLANEFLQNNTGIKFDPLHVAVSTDYSVYVQQYANSLKDMNKDILETDNKFQKVLNGRGPLIIYAPGKSDSKTPKVNPKINNEIYDNPNDAQKKALEAVDIWTAKEQDKAKQRHLKGLDSEEKYQNKLIDIAEKSLEKKQKLYSKSDKEYSDIQLQLDDIKIKRQDDAEKLSLKAMKQLNDGRFNAIVLYDNAQREELNQQLEDGLISEDEYKNSILALDKVLAEARLYAAKENAHEIDSFQYKSDEERIAAVEASNKEIEKAEENLTAAEKTILHKSATDKKEIQRQVEELEKKYGIDERKSKYKEYQEGLVELKNKYQLELKLYENDARKKAEITKKYEKDVSAMKLKMAEQTAENISQIASAALKLSNSLQEAETIGVDNKYAQQLNAAKKAGQDTTDIEAKVEDEKKSIKKKYADIDFAINVAQIIASTALAVMKAAPSVPLMVLTGLAGAAELVVAEQQRESIKNLWTGGFTDEGDKYEARGIVHAGEFVGNQEATHHPPIRNFFNLIDHAQRTNTIARIDNDAIARALSIKQGAGSFSGSGTSTAGNQPITIDLSAVVATMRETTAVNAALLAEIKKGFKSNVSVSGKGGIKEAMDKYDNLMNNISR